MKLVTGRSLQMGYNDRFSTYETFHCCFVVQIKNMYKENQENSLQYYSHYNWYLDLSFEWFPLTIQNLVALRFYFKSNLSLAVKGSIPSVMLSNATSIHISMYKWIIVLLLCPRPRIMFLVRHLQFTPCLPIGFQCHLQEISNKKNEIKEETNQRKSILRNE